MNKNVTALVIVVVLLLLGVGGYMLFGNKSARDTAPQTSPTSEQNQPVMGGAKSLKELLAGGQPQTCTFSDAETQGSVFVGGGKIRGDFTNLVNGTQTGSHMISDGQMFYMWTDGQTQGFKMEFTPSEATPGAETKMPKDSFDPDKKVDYNCSGWTVDQSKFALPANVKFTDTKEMMPQGAKIQDTKTDQCAACNNLTGDAAAQCKKALGC